MNLRTIFCIVVIGCSPPLAFAQIDYKPSTETVTTISKDVLRQRLSRKNVNFIETSDCGKPNCIPNPLLLEIEITKNYSDSFRARLNNEEEYNFDGLVSKLNSVFNERESKGIFQEGTNDIEKAINLAANDDDISDYEKNNVTVEDFEKLIDDLREKGINKIAIDFIGLPRFIPFSFDLPKSAITKGKAVNPAKRSKRSKRRS